MSSENWRTLRVSDICTKVVSGGTPSTRNPEYYGGSIPWLKTQEVNFNRIYETETKITDAGLKNSSAKWIPSNSVIMAMYGATAGKIAINKKPITTNQACCNLIINDKIADYRYVYYNLMSRFQEIASMAVGGAQQNLNAEMIRDLEIPLPPLSIQSRIADVLSTLDEKIELNRQTNATFEAIAQAIFKEWFVDLNYPSATGEMVESELGPIPKGWKVSNLGDEGEFKNGINYSRNESGDHTYSIVNVRNIVGNRYLVSADLDKIDIYSKKASPYLLSALDIVLARSANPGEAAILFETSEFTIFSGFTIRYRIHIKEHVLFFFLLIQSIKEKLADLANGTTLRSINQASLKNVKIALPHPKLLGDFSVMVTPIYEEIFRNQLESRILCKIRDLLMPQLMNNNLDIG